MKSHLTDRQYGDIMSMIHSWISEASTTLKLQFEPLSAEGTGDLFQRLRQKHADSGSELPLWETIGEHISRKRANGWRDVGEYVGDGPCLLLTEKDGQEAYRVSSGDDLTKLLSECPGFEFYVTNEEIDFLLCHNHHDYLIGAGKAASWVATKDDDSEATTTAH